MKTYLVRAQRDGKFWHLRVPEIGHSTQARHVGEADFMARDLIALTTDQPHDSFDVEIVYEPGEAEAFD